MLDERFAVEETSVLPDDPAALSAELIRLADERGIALVLTSGGTGLAARDRTPQATAAVLDYEVPGLAEAMRASSWARVPTAMLSRAVAGVRGRTLVVNLPGSPWESSCRRCPTRSTCWAAKSRTVEPRPTFLFRERLAT